MTDDDRFAARVRRTLDTVGSAVPDAEGATWAPAAVEVTASSTGRAGAARWWMAAAAVLLLAGGVWVATRGDDGSTGVVAPGSTVTGSSTGDTGSTAAPNDDPQAVVAEWQALIAGKTIAYTIEPGCFCQYNGIWFVVERDGEVLRSVVLGPMTQDNPVPDGTPPTFVLSQALSWATTATGEVVVYDNTTTSLQMSVDSIKDAIDDEFGFTMTGFSIVDGSPEDVPIPPLPTTTTLPPVPADFTPVLPAATPALTLDEIPRMLPDPLATGGPLLRSSDPDTAPPAASSWLQVYGNETGAWLHVETTATQVPVPQGDTIGPWAATERSSGGDAVLELATPAVTVTLWSATFTPDELRGIAARMQQLPDGTWDLGELPGGMQLVASGPNTMWTARRVVQLDPATGLVLALEVLPDAPSLLSTYAQPAGTVVDIDGARGIYQERTAGDGTTIATLAWQWSPRIVVRIGALGADQEQMLAMARAVHGVSPQEWDALDVAADGDGCPAYWC